MRPFVTACVLAVGALCLSAPQIGTMPPSLSEDEVTIALTAQSIATSGKDLVGRSWPLYIQITDGSWYHPVIVYSIALVLQVLPLSEFAIRLPSLCAGAANVVLMYFLARVLFRREAAAILAAVLLALTPTHFLHSRVAHEYLYPVPFILAWLLCLFSYLERDDPRWLFASTAALGVGFYSYIGSVLVMPMYLMLTGLVLLQRHKPARAGGIALAGFLLPVLPLFVPWLVLHQPAFSNTVGHYLIYDTPASIRFRDCENCSVTRASPRERRSTGGFSIRRSCFSISRRHSSLRPAPPVSFCCRLASSSRSLYGRRFAAPS